MNREFATFLKFVGGRQEAQELLGVSQGMISHLVIGRREVSQEIAKIIVDKYPTISLYYLLYGDAI